jgi:uncharacterized protein (TIGR02145 family)
MSQKLTLSVVLFFYLMSLWPQSSTHAVNQEDEIQFSPDAVYGAYRDQRDNRSYKTVQIGDQVWMAENLAYLPEVNTVKLPSIHQPQYYVYGYEGSDIREALSTYSYNTYGVLYNFPAASSACPDGWHLPSLEDWDLLVKKLGWYSSSGSKMKENGTRHWFKNEKSTTNTSGLTLLPGGILDHSGVWHDMGKKGNFWVANVRDEENANAISLSGNSSWAGGSFFQKSSGLSVRCIKN